MASVGIKDMVIRKMQWHSNHTELNHLGRALVAKPEMMYDNMQKIFSAYRYSENPLSVILGGKSELVIDKSEWEWMLRGASERPALIMENTLTGGAAAGLNKTQFTLKFAENRFVAGDVIYPGTLNKSYQVRVQADPTRHGAGWLYTVVGNWDDKAMFIPAKYLEPNTKWVKLFSVYEEGSEQSGSTDYSMPMHLASRLSRIRKHYKVTGDAAREVLDVTMIGEDGNKYNGWIKYAEAEFYYQWYREIERLRWYSQSTSSVQGSTGRPTRQGPGILELLEKSHTYTYSTVSAQLFEDFASDIFYGRIAPGAPARKLRVGTGEIGMRNFHRAINDREKSNGFLQVTDDINLQKTSSSYHANSLTAGYQFTRARFANGIEMEVFHVPAFDDTTVNTEINPKTGFPYESERYVFLDFSGEGMESNIKLVRKRDSMIIRYIEGMASPFGYTNQASVAHAGDYYEMHAHEQVGIHIEDITRCGMLIPKVS